MKKPTVSILMTIYNHQNYLKNSIKSIINQTYKNWELIVIDNGSIDDSAKILKEIKDKRLKKFFIKKNIGRTKCLNLGLKSCKGKFIAILDSDDVAKKNRLQLQLNAFRLDQDLWMVASDFNHIDNSGKLIFYPKVAFDLKKNIKQKPRMILLRNPIAHSSVMYRTQLLKKVGAYPKSYLYAQDYAFYLKVFRKYKIKILSQKLVNIRVPHRKSETVRILNTNRALLEHIRLLVSNLVNFKSSLHEKFLILSSLIFNIIKFFTPKILIHRRYKIFN
jgi:glycosyltransferase involved in cell wall biosynthesis